MSASASREQAEHHYYSGLDLFADGKYAEAAAEYRLAAAADPAFTDAMHALSKALQELHDLDGAIDVSKRITEVDPEDVLAHTSLSILYQKKGMVPEAEAESNQARILGWKQTLREQKEKTSR